MLQQQFAFLREIEKLKGVTRANRTLDGRPENSAEHSWNAALMALVLGDYAEQPLDMFTVIKLLLIHDLVEIEAGDTWLFATDQTDKVTREEAAACNLYAHLPAHQQAEYLQLWRDFEARTTAEAQFAAAIDGLQPLLNHLLTGDPTEAVITFDQVLAKKRYIQQFAPKLWGMVEQLIAESADRGLYL
jgi:putative hydrolase of HD superfamily